MVCKRLIHFIDEQDRRDLVLLKQIPERLCMSLYAISRTDQKHCCIQYLQRSFHFRRKIHMARRIQQRHFSSLHGKSCLLGKDRDTTFPLQRIRIQERILVIHTSYLPECPAGIQKTFR